VANKIGTYMMALAAHDNNVPFYVALPDSTFDWEHGSPQDIIIEQRGGEEVKYVEGQTDAGELGRVLITPKDAEVANYAFDITPPRLITGLITPSGVIEPNEAAIRKHYGKRFREKVRHLMTDQMDPSGSDS
ncbi:TPA: hypothetical protein HA265_05685, partial [Candidatus Woesearchaeota archaeon]|nr:hypothetical protein [Candidatus Woesearchaeota archaeon]